MGAHTTMVAYLVHCQHSAIAKVGNTFLRQVKNSSGCGDNHMDSLAEAHDVVFQAGASSGDQDVHA